MLTISEMSYSKLHSSLVSSSLWCERDDVRILFITMLALADRDGYVWGSRSGIHRQANCQVYEDGEEDPFDVLMEPDCCSSDLLRNPANEGKRIEEVEGGFRIINYEYYRGLRNDDDRKIQNREAQKRHRKKVSQGKPPSAKISQDKPQSAHAEAEADAESIKKPTVSFIEKLKNDPLNTGVDIDRELERAKRWCRDKNRRCTERFFKGWVERADRVIKEPESKREKPELTPEQKAMDEEWHKRWNENHGLKKD